MRSLVNLTSKGGSKGGIPPLYLYTCYTMARKTCIPGLFCIENMTFALLFIVLFIMIYLYHTNITRRPLAQNGSNADGSLVQPVVFVVPPNANVNHMLPVDTRQDPMQRIDGPPLKYIEEGASTSYGLPVNIKTRGYEGSYSQVGILTRKSGKEQILPLMGRKGSNARDKYQYYTMTNTAGNINTKLPVSVNGKSCTSEMGCDEIYNGDTIFVEGFHDTFQATIYESGLFRYIPFI